MCSSVVYLILVLDAVVYSSVLNTVILSKLLELTVAASYAGEALSVMS